MATTERALPSGPKELTGQTWRYVARRTWREFMDDACTDLAAALTYYAVLSLFPALIALISLVTLVGQRDAVLGVIEDLVSNSAVPGSDQALRPALDSIAASTPRSGLALVVGIATALWSASGYVGSFGRAMNRIYEVREGRPFWKLRPWRLVITLGLVLLTAAVTVALVVSGPVARAVGDALGLGDVAVRAWDLAKWPVVLVVVAVIVAILYHTSPNVDQPRFRWVSPGALLAVLVWVLASLLFGLYVSGFSSYDRTYGALAGVVVFLLWLWITNLALLFGAELDCELERGRELQGGLPAEDDLHLPLRDDRQIRSEDRKAEQDRMRARALRTGAEGHPGSEDRPG